MSLSVLQSLTAIGWQGVITPFSATGGTPPYTFAVEADGAGGTINSATGVYASPNATGIDIITVTDSVGANVTTMITVCSPIELVCDIIQTQMLLSQGQVYLWDQKLKVPPDDRLYVAVGVLSCKPFGNSNTIDANGNSFQSVNVQAALDINVLSKSIEAVYRKEEVILALGSSYAQYQQEANSFYVGKLPIGFVNLSEIEGAAIPYRFNITVYVQYAMTKLQSVPIYTQFQKSQIVTNP